MSLAMSSEEKILSAYVVSTGSVPITITIDVSDYLTDKDIHDIEEFASRNCDTKTKTFINNILRDNR